MRPPCEKRYINKIYLLRPGWMCSLTWNTTCDFIKGCLVLSSHCKLLKIKKENDASRLCEITKGCLVFIGTETAYSLRKKKMCLSHSFAQCEMKVGKLSEWRHMQTELQSLKASNPSWQVEKQQAAVLKYTFIYTVKQIHFKTSYKDSLW